MTLPWIHVDGDRLADADGGTVTLHGVGLGGWMTMENFIAGYPGIESRLRHEMARVLGPTTAEAFFDSYLEAFFGADDAAHLASLGINSVRIPVSYHHFEDDAAPFELHESGFRRLDRVVRILADAGIYSIIDLHVLPGAQNHHWHSDNPAHLPFFWQHRHFQDRVVHLWEALADRYRDEPAVAGYNPINEPADESGEVLPAFYARLEKAIRAIDDRHVLFLDGNKYSTDFSPFSRNAEPLPNCVYTAHDYALPGIAADATAYPGVTRGEYVDRDVLEADFLRRTAYMRATGTPIWIGEFGPTYPDESAWRYRILADQLAIYAEHGASWSLWTYKDIGLQGLVHVAPQAPYLARIAPSLEQKRRLGLDSWGGSAAGVAHLTAPIEELVAAEFPDYHPYPWGPGRHIAQLVRHVLLAEPATEAFARQFAGLGPDDVAELARDFSFERCVERTPLSDLLRDRLR